MIVEITFIFVELLLGQCSCWAKQTGGNQNIAVNVEIAQFPHYSSDKNLICMDWWSFSFSDCLKTHSDMKFEGEREITVNVGWIKYIYLYCFRWSEIINKEKRNTETQKIGQDWVREDFYIWQLIAFRLFAILSLLNNYFGFYYESTKLYHISAFWLLLFLPTNVLL